MCIVLFKMQLLEKFFTGKILMKIIFGKLICLFLKTGNLFLSFSKPLCHLDFLYLSWMGKNSKHFLLLKVFKDVLFM